MKRKLKKLAKLIRPETNPQFHDDAAAVAAAARAGRIRHEFMTPAQIDQLNPPSDAPRAFLTVDAAAAQLTHLRFRSPDWWRSMTHLTGLRLVLILEEIGDEIEGDDDDDIGGIINRALDR